MTPAAHPALETFEFPCSFAQQRLWIDDRLAGGSAFYNIHASIRVPVALEPATLERGLDALVARHETLRTTFIERDGTPMQQVASAGRCDFASVDLRLLDSAAREAQVLALAQAQSSQPFDLARGPLLRVRLLGMAAAESVLMLTIHHIVADAWSMGVLLREITALYEAAALSCLPALPELPIQYADYAVWQRHVQDVAGADAGLAYWCRQLADMPTLGLPTDRPHLPMASHRGHTLHWALPAELSQRALQFAQRHSLTPYIVLLAALSIVLQRQAAQDEVVVGVPVAGRDRPELEGLIGFFVNTLVLRIGLGGEPCFLVLAQRVQQALQQALAHATVPFERLVEALKPPRDLSRNPLFQVSVQYLAAPGVANPARGAATVLEVQRGAANFDLSFDFWLSAGQLQGRVDYATDLFDKETVQRMADQVARVLSQALANPQASIEGLDLLSAAERAQLLGDWAGAAAHYPRDSNLAEQWAAVVRQRPQAPAVSAPGAQWTYVMLDARANSYAVALAERGAGPGQCIGIAMARGPEQVAALLGIVQLGAAYVALEPGWPASRLARCIDAAGVAQVLCDDSDTAGWAPPSVRALRPSELPAASVAALPPTPIDPLAPAYVAFTSGSTGVPKGVMVPHRAVLRLACDNPQVPLVDSDRMLVFAPLAFDASTLEIWAPLLRGACLSIPPAGPLGLDELARWIEHERITVAWLTAGLFHQLAGTHVHALARIERLYAGGDVLGSDAVQRVLRAGGGRTRVFNGYGPTENTTFTCVHEMRQAADAAPPVPIGRPIANGFVRVLDARGRLLPVGVPGELFAGGDGLALGYLGDPELTAQRFVADPLDPAGGRVYRTGDRVRWRANGRLEFLGRIDRQLKVRGYRIEPGEIETVLRTLPGVADAHVLARADGSGDKRLLAYVAGTGLAGPSELLDRLAARLPAWMLPSEIHLCTELRLNANGKIDEDALGDDQPGLTCSAGTTADVAALEGDVEALVAQVWSEVLSRPVADARSAFFTDLGGHSLLATQAVSRLNAALGIELPLARIFEEPTLRGFAREVESLLLAELEAGAA